MSLNSESAKKDDRTQSRTHQPASTNVSQVPTSEAQGAFATTGVSLEGQASMMANTNIPVMQRQAMAQKIGNTLGNQGLNSVISRLPNGVIQRQAISQEDREWLYDRITFRMSTAYTNFANACDQVIGEINAEIAANKAFITTLAGIALGYLNPAVTAGIGSVINNIPDKAPDSIYQAALYLTNNGWAWQGTYAAVTTVAKDKVVNSLSASGGGTTDYIELLKQATLEEFDDIHGSANSLNDQQLLALFTAYDPAHVTQPAFAEQIRTQATHFQTQVVDQGVEESWRIDGPNIKEITRLIGVRIGNGRPIVAIARKGGYTGTWEIIEWVTPDVGMEAVKETILMYGGIPVVPDGTMDIRLIGSSASGPSYRLPDHAPTGEYSDPDEINTPAPARP